MATLLIVDDEPNVLYSLEKGLQRDGLRVMTAATAAAGLKSASEHAPDAVLLDVQLPDLSGIDALERFREIDAKLPVVIMTAHGTAETAIEAMKRGAFDYVLKPWKLSDLRQIVASALQAGHLSRVPAVMEELSDHADARGAERDHIIGRSPQMQDVFKEIGRIAPQDVNVLLLGESGTGKELVARAVYHHSRRAEGPFLAINCAAIPESLLESELFGHERGAFTGADRQRIGKFEQADGGTLFLDEIGDMSAATQAKLLRVLQDGRFERVGGGETLEVNVRTIAATNSDLDVAIQSGDFRKDLYYRLNTFTLVLPPLRERRDDVPLLAQHFLRRDRRRLGVDVRGISSAALECLQNHCWPGNVRELESAIRYAVVHSGSDVITVDALPISVRGDAVASATVSESARDFQDVTRRTRKLLEEGQTGLSDILHADVDRVLIEEVLRNVDGHLTKAADVLGVSRTTLRSRMQQLGLSVEKDVRSSEDRSA